MLDLSAIHCQTIPEAPEVKVTFQKFTHKLVVRYNSIDILSISLVDGKIQHELLTEKEAKSLTVAGVHIFAAPSGYRECGRKYYVHYNLK